MSKVVLDASAGLALVLPETHGAVVSEHVARWHATGTAVVVPSLFWLEVSNVLVRRFRSDGSRALEALYELEALGLHTLEVERPTLLLTLDLMERHGLTSYDAVYLALAQSLDARLVTLDAELAVAAGKRAVRLPGVDRVGEDTATYERKVAWPEWPGAQSYLKELRTRVTRSPSARRPRG